MRLAVGEPLPPSAAAPDQVSTVKMKDSKSTHPTNLAKEP
jgi:hypothetical protein